MQRLEQLIEDGKYGLVCCVVIALFFLMDAFASERVRKWDDDDDRAI